MKKKVSQAQSNWFVFKEAPPYKSGVRRSAQPRYEYGEVTSTTATHGVAVRAFFPYLSLFKVIPETFN